MGTSLRQWESDPFFSAAEVVQDSADRMESIFQRLLHEQALVQETTPYSSVRPSIEYAARELKTTLETTKWQLEDFERAVSLAAATDSSGLRTDIISRHEDFVNAIREQILDVEKHLGSSLVKQKIGSTDLANMNERENDRLALFLSGGSQTEIMPHLDLDESTMLRRFLVPTPQLGFTNSSNEIIEHGPEDIRNLSGDRLVPVVHDSLLLQGKGLHKVGSSLQAEHDARFHLKNSASDQYGKDGGWDLESGEDKSPSSKKRKLKSNLARRNMLCVLGSFFHANVNRIYKSLMKKKKDEEERCHSSLDTNIFQREQDCHGRRSFSWSGLFQMPLHELNVRSTCLCQRLCSISYHRSLCHSLAIQHFMQLVLAIICFLIILAILAVHVA